MMDSATTLVCRPIAVAIRGDDGKLRTIGNVAAKPVRGPDLSQALTPQQIDGAYMRWLEKVLNIDPQVYHSS
jgi:predicted GNAT family N-acyltransferase